MNPPPPTLILRSILLILGCVRSEQLIDRCLISQFTHLTPKLNPIGVGKCHLYYEKSCCRPNYSKNVADIENGFSKMYGFNLTHCGPFKNPRCLDWFRMDACAYGCNAYFNFWRRKFVMDWRFEGTESFENIPLCLSDCEQWYDDCKQEKTCVSNWVTDFKWIRQSDSLNPSNKCPQHSRCETFEKVYGSARGFCEKIWNGMYKVKNDRFLYCFHLDYDRSDTEYPAHAYAVYINHS